MCTVFFSALILAFAMPCDARPDSQTGASSAAPLIQSTADKSKPDEKKAEEKENPPEGTPAVVVDDNTVESLLGKVVVSASGEKLGPITDVLVSHSGDVRAAVIDFGGFLGVGTRKVAVAWSALRFSTSGISLNMTKDEVRVTPEYREGQPIVIVGPSAEQPSGSASSTHKPAPSK
jgi:hypothetical protein